MNCPRRSVQLRSQLDFDPAVLAAPGLECRSCALVRLPVATRLRRLAAAAETLRVSSADGSSGRDLLGLGIP